jgi:hypothetical protein
MSQQLQITGGAKVRNLQDVIVGDSGVLSSLGFNVANGVPKLDTNGKILVSQLPNSVMEYLGTWNVATNTPYLVNGTGNAGDVYLVEGAATGGTSHNFGAGAITFFNGDQVIYSGSIWQRATGSTGSVTSVAITESGDALSITGSPITTSGTINIGFAGTSAQYVAGDGTLVTFPTIITEAQNLITEVYNETGATLTKGTVVYINGGHGNLPTVTKAIATSDMTSAQTYGVIREDITNNNNGYVTVVGRLSNLDTQAYSAGTQLYLSSTTAGAWTSTKQYAPNHLVYVGIVVRSHPTQGVVEVKIQNGYELDELHNVSAQTPSNNDGLFYNSSTSLWENKSIATVLGYTPANDSLVVHLAGTETITGAKTFSSIINADTGILLKNSSSGPSALGYIGLGGLSGGNGLRVNLSLGRYQELIFAGTTSDYSFTFPATSGTIALTSDIPSLSGYVTIATTQTITGDKTFDGVNIFNGITTFNGIYQTRFRNGVSLDNTYSGGGAAGYTTLGSTNSGIQINLSDGAYNNLNFLNTYVGHTYSFPNNSGTIALTSDTANFAVGAPLSYTSGTLTISQATTSTNGYLSSTDWNTFNNKVPTARTLTINGTTYDLSADRSWTVSGSQWTTSGSNIYYTTGAVLIGKTTQDAGAYLEVQTPTGGPATITCNSTTSDSPYIYLRQAGSSTFGAIQSNTALVFKTNNTEAVRINTSGNMGIGTTNPTVALEVNGRYRTTSSYSSAGTTVFEIYNASSTGYGLYMGAGSGTNYSFKVADYANNVRFTILGNGNVGIGTNPQWALSGYTGIDIGNYGLIYSSISSGTNIAIVNNLYHNGSNWIYKNTGSGSGIGQDSGSITFSTVGSGTGGNVATINERVRITNAGYLGVNCTPNAQFEVLGASGNLLTDGIRVSRNTLQTSQYGVINYSSGILNLTAVETSTAGEIRFNTSNGTTSNERIRINGAGQLLIGTTDGSSLANFVLGGNTNQCRVLPVADGGGYIGDSGHRWIAIYAQNGSINTSDRNEKKNIVPTDLGLDFVIKLKPVSYNWKKGENTEKKHYGIIAQDVEELAPDFGGVWVEDGKYGFSYTELIAPLIKAIQELKAEIDELKNK